MSFIFVIPLKEKISTAHPTGILAKVEGSCAILSYHRTEFCNKSLIAACDQLGIKQIYSTPSTQKEIAILKTAIIY